jgi:O-antigen ligase
MLAGYVVGCTLTAIDGWRAFLSGEMHRSTIRYSAEAFDPNDMAVTLAIGIPAAAYLALGRRRWAWLVLAYLPIAASAVVLSGSRAGAITTAVAVGIVVARVRRRSGTALVAAVALLLAGVFVTWRTVPRDLWTRMYTIREQVAQGDMNGRTAIWRAGLDVFARNPVVGVGQGGFKKAVSGALHAEVTAHSTLLPVAAELGLVGLVLFLGAFASALLGHARVASDERALAFALAATWLVGSATLSWELRKTTWFVLLVAAALAALRSVDRPGVTRGDRAGCPVGPRHAASRDTRLSD